MTVEEASEKPPDLFEAALRGEEVLIIISDDDSERSVRLVVADNKVIQRKHPWGTPKAGSAKGLFIMSDDFDEPLEDFEEYMR